MITAETITDEQIRELRELGEQIRLAVERATLPKGHVAMRAWGRARCAEILNARAAGSK